jgi:hypothetical protein
MTVEVGLYEILVRESGEVGWRGGCGEGVREVGRGRAPAYPYLGDGLGSEAAPDEPLRSDFIRNCYSWIGKMNVLRVRRKGGSHK